MASSKPSCRQRRWEAHEVELMREIYPHKGKRAMMFLLGRTEGQIRQKAADLKLRFDKSSKFFKEWQRRAASSKVGKKRPEQSLVMKRLHDEGKLIRTQESRAKQGRDLSRHIKKFGHPKGATGMKHSDKTLATLSRKSREAWKAMSKDRKQAKVAKMMKTRDANGTYASNRPRGSWKADWREIGGIRKYYRSKWEANYARWLQFLKEQGKVKEWEHEPRTFWFENIKRGCRSYLPDFKVTLLDGTEEYHEVKGWMDKRSVTKIKRMKKYYPKVKLIVIDSKAYQSITKNAKLVIQGWE